MSVWCDGLEIHYIYALDDFQQALSVPQMFEKCMTTSTAMVIALDD